MVGTARCAVRGGPPQGVGAASRCPCAMVAVRKDRRACLNPFHDLTLGLQPVVQFMARFAAAR
jgi:hypothetical protein